MSAMSLDWTKFRFTDIAFNLNDRMGEYGDKGNRTKHSPDLEWVLRKASWNGVDKILATGTCLKSSRDTIDSIKRWRTLPMSQTGGVQIFCTVGIHPTNSQDFGKYKQPDLLLEELRKLINENRDIVKAYGELGLDRARTSYCDFDIQEKYLIPQLQLAETLNLPLFLHNREAGDLFYPALKRHPKALSSGGVVHSFDGNRDELNLALELGLDIGINGCSMKTDDMFSVINEIPNDRLHFETDAPWCLIKPAHASWPLINWTASQYKAVRNDKNQVPDLEGGSVINKKDAVLVKGRNEPLMVAQVAECIYKIKGSEDKLESFQKFTQTVYERSNKIFHLN